MNLANIFKRDNQNIKNSDSVKLAEAMSKGERNYRTQSEIRNLLPGQTIQGEVVSRSGSSIQLALANNMLVNARLDQNIAIALGQSMNFEVKTNNGSILSLSPLYANMANEATIMRALSAAGLPETAENMAMVAKMMEEGMPIDKESILAMSRQLLEFPGQNPEAIIQMSRLELPITEANIEQFQNYMNNNHQILGSVENIMDGLPQVFSELMGEGKAQQAYAFYEAVLNIFTGTEEGVQTAEGKVVLTDAASAENVQAGGTPAENVQASDTPAGSAQTGEALADPSLAEETAKQVISDADVLSKNAQENTIQQEGEQTANVAGKEQNIRSELDARQWSSLADLLKELGASEKTAEQIKSGTLPAKEVLALIKDLMPKAGTESISHEALERLFNSKEFQGLLKEEMSRQWLIEPKNVERAEEVEKLYERVREQTARLNEALQIAGKADLPVAKSVQNLQNNVDFMNQMNQMFTYVQLPLMLAGNHAHGDLYVYTNKKNLASKDGNVSALLHLDMEHLGPLDVYVTMQQNKVNTNFTLRDESSLNLIEENIHLLDERLAKRGYDLKAQFQIKEEEQEEAQSIMQTILSQDKNISVLSRTSFDMRA